MKLSSLNNLVLDYGSSIEQQIQTRQDRRMKLDTMKSAALNNLEIEHENSVKNIGVMFDTLISFESEEIHKLESLLDV